MRGGRSPQRAGQQQRGQQHYDNDNQGVLFWREEKKEDTHPDWTGSITVAGREYEVIGWARVSQKTGKNFISLKVTKEKL